MSQDNAPLLKSGLSILALVPPLVIPQLPIAWAVPFVVLGLGLVAFSVYSDWRRALPSWREWVAQLGGLGACFLVIVWLHQQGPLAPIGIALLIVTGLVMLALVISMFKNLSRALEHASPTQDDALAKKVLPYDVDARSAILYAATGTWNRSASSGPATRKLAAELDRVFKVLEEFYEYAGSGVLHVWGRAAHSRPPKPIEPTHWQDWHIDYTTIFADLPTAEPVRTVPRDRLPSESSPYYDLRLSKVEVERLWPHENVSLAEGARRAFEETKICHGYDQGSEDKLWHHMVLIALEAKQRPENMTLWGSELPSSKTEPIPTSDIDISLLAKDGAHLLQRVDAFTEGNTKWANLQVAMADLDDHVERLKRGESVGQQPAPNADVPPSE